MAVIGSISRGSIRPRWLAAILLAMLTASAGIVMRARRDPPAATDDDTPLAPREIALR